MARNVKDAATFLSAMAGKSEQDRLTDEIPFEKIPDYALSCATTDFKGIRIGVPPLLVGKLEPEEAISFEVAVSVLTMLGATVIHDVALLAEERWKATTNLQRMKLKRADFPSSIAAYLETLTTNPRGIRTLQDLIEQTKRDPEEDYPNHNRKL